MRKVATIIALVACAHAMIWMLDNRRETPPAIAGKLASLSYNRFVGPPSGIAANALPKSLAGSSIGCEAKARFPSPRRKTGTSS